MAQPTQTRVGENPDPHEQYNPVPRVLIGLVAALLVWAVYYIFSAAPDSTAAMGDRRDPAALAQGAAGEGGAGESGAIDGRQIFAASCQACHQATGQGLPGVFPPLAGSRWITGDPAILARIVLHGLTGEIEVSGATYNGAMPAFGEQFGDAELAAVLGYVRGAWGNGAAEVEPSLVEAVRRETAGQAGPWQGQAQLMQAVGAAAAATSAVPATAATPAAR